MTSENIDRLGADLKAKQDELEELDSQVVTEGTSTPMKHADTPAGTITAQPNPIQKA